MVNNSSKKILIVDDEAHIREIIRFRLQIDGYQTIEAKNGHEAVEQIAKHKPDLVILDIMMPDMDGWEVCKFARSQSEFQSIPILMLTAKIEIKDKIHGMQAGANDYLTKPFSPNELMDHIKNLLA